MGNLAGIRRQAAKLKTDLAQAALERGAALRGGKGRGGYPDDPVGYARNVLGITTLTPDQETILRHLLLPPYKVLVPSAHDVGKAQPVDLLIDTPAGRKRFGDLQTGDQVFGLDGRPMSVTG